MHERSLVAALLKQVADIQQQYGQAPVREIVVEVGPLSGVEPMLLQSAFQDLSPRDVLLMIETTPLVARCLNCLQMLTMERFMSQCSLCQSTDLQIISGDEYRLLRVTLDEALLGNSP